MFIVGRVEFQFVARRAFGPEVLAQAGSIVGYQGIGGIQYVGGGTVVLFQPVQDRRGKVLLKTLHVLHPGAAEAVDGLVVVSDCEQVVVPARQQPQPGILQRVGILELVHQDMAKALPVMSQEIVPVTKQFVGSQQEFGKVNQAGAITGLLVAAVNRYHLLQDGIAVNIDMLRSQTLVLLPVYEPLRLLGGILVLIQVQPAYHPAQGTQLVLTVEDLKTVRQARFLPVQAQYPVGKPVESAHPHAAGRAFQQGLDPGAHLRGGLVGERDRQYAVWRSLFRVQVPGDTMHQHPGLTAAGAGKHQDIAGRRGHCLALRLVQSV